MGMILPILKRIHNPGKNFEAQTIHYSKCQLYLHATMKGQYKDKKSVNNLLVASDINSPVFSIRSVAQ